MRYEVHIPRGDGEEYDTRLSVEAATWMTALRTALARKGLPSGSALLCDIQEDRTIRVVDPTTQRQYFVRMVEEPEEDASDTFEMTPQERAALVARALRDRRQAEARDPTPLVLNEERVPSGQFGNVPTLFDPTTIEDGLVERILTELEWVYGEDHHLSAVTERVLDLAMQLIPSESGAVFYVGLQGTDLHFAAARGPKGEQVMGYRVPMSRGIVGFCVREGISLSVQEAHSDERLYDTIARAVDYYPSTLLCAPLKCEGRVFGALELLNKRDGASYSLTDLGMLAHVAHQLANYINLHL